MDFETHGWWSPALRQEMQLRVYGRGGKPVVVFPSSGGSFYEYQDFGMVEAVRPFVEEGRISLVTLDSVDKQSWLNRDSHPADRARRHQEYDRYVVDEVTPFVRGHVRGAERFLATGCSMGGYHSANFLFRHPDVFDAVVALSGVFQLSEFIGGFVNDDVYFNTPLSYLPNLGDPWYLDRYRQAQIAICVGQGAWEEPMIEDARKLQAILESKGVPAWFDYWGHDVNHDWPWWRVQMPYFLSKLAL
jgi:esterase/lipase superfamily enzyme